MKILTAILYIFLINFSLTAQPSRNAVPLSQMIFSEINYFPKSGNEVSCYFSYRIPVNILVFEKINQKYSAEYKVLFDIYDEKGNFVLRKSHGNSLSFDEFSMTNENDIYAQGVIDFLLNIGKNYSLKPIIIDDKSDREIKLPAEIIELNKKLNTKPIILFEKKCAGDFTLANFGANIPFSDEDIILLLPGLNESLKSFIIINNNDTIKEGTFSRQIDFSAIKICEKDNAVALSVLNKELSNGYAIDNFSKDLLEGKTSLIIFGEKKTAADTFYFNTEWINKPFSLNDYDDAISLLKHVEKEERVKELQLSDDPKEALISYWKEKDNDSSSAFNPVMEEYYRRIDYASKEFSSLNGRSGENSDRGKIYIKFGKPAKVERSSNPNGKITETWFYKNKKFTFVDRRGTGEFFLRKG